MKRRAALLCSLVFLWAAPLDAQDAADSAPVNSATSRRHVALLIDASADVDAFTKMYLYEVISGQLQQHGFVVTAADPGAASRPALECVAAEACRRTLMNELHAPLVVAVHLEPSAPGRLRVSLRTSDGAASLDAEDEEANIATALDRTLAALDPAAVPCLVMLETAVAGTELRIHGDTTPLPSLIDPGEHEARLEAPGRRAWDGPLVCRGGGVLRVHVR